MNNCASMVLIDLWICFHRWSTAFLHFVFESRAQKSGTGNNKFVKCKGNFGPTGPTGPTGQSGPPSKLVPNIPVGPNRNGPFHLMYQPKLPEFWVAWKAPLVLPYRSLRPCAADSRRRRRQMFPYKLKYKLLRNTGTKNI